MAHNVHPQMWDDAKFLSFDDTTRVLWVCLLTGPHRKALPGLFRATAAELADTLQRPLELIRDSLKWLEREGMALHDPDARVICVPNAPKWARRPNPTQLVAWFAQWRALPTCELKFAHIPRLEALVNPEHARAAVRNAWGRTFGEVRQDAPVPQGWVDLDGDSPPHTPPLTNKQTLSLPKSLKRDAIRMAGSGSDNVRKKERNDSVNFGDDTNSPKMRDDTNAPGPSADDGFKQINENDSLRLDAIAPTTSNFTHGSPEKEGAEKWQNADLEPRPDIQNEQNQQPSSSILTKNDKSQKTSGSPGRSETQVVETTGERQRETQSISSKIHHRDRLPEWCLSKARRKRSPTPP